MVEGPGRGRSSLLWFLVGTLVGGATSGAAIGMAALLVPLLPGVLVASLIGATALVVLLHDAGIRRFPFPQNARQVRQTVVQMQPASGALMFGFELGTGVRTYVTGAAPYIAVVAALAADGHEPLPGILLGVGFGLGRGLVPLDRRIQGDETNWDRWVSQHGKRTLPLVGALATTVATAAALA